jgi:ubiquinone/menaquinone biosynthesis C-methylase UbiE
MRLALLAALLAACAASRPVAPMGSHGAHRHGEVPELHRTFDRFVAAMDSPRRAAWQKPDEVLRALGIRPGQAVADLGAGTGYFTFRLAAAVGPTGKVYAVDVDERMIEILRRRKREAGADQVTLVRTEPDDPGLAPASVDLGFICDTYHHIRDRHRWLRRLRSALKAGGRVVNVDFVEGPLPVGPPPSHKIPERQVREEFARAGFRLTREIKILPYQYIHVWVPEEERR